MRRCGWEGVEVGPGLVVSCSGHVFQWCSRSLETAPEHRPPTALPVKAHRPTAATLSTSSGGGGRASAPPGPSGPAARRRRPSPAPGHREAGRAARPPVPPRRGPSASTVEARSARIAERWAWSRSSLTSWSDTKRATVPRRRSPLIEGERTRAWTEERGIERHSRTVGGEAVKRRREHGRACRVREGERPVDLRVDAVVCHGRRACAPRAIAARIIGHGPSDCRHGCEKEL
jgi:hypothetical protein